MNKIILLTDYASIIVLNMMNKKKVKVMGINPIQFYVDIGLYTTFQKVRLYIAYIL